MAFDNFLFELMKEHTNTHVLTAEQPGTAAQTSGLEGFGLPLGSNVGTLSGERLMLIGDAASLVDPISTV
jgi:flavin-dependent dehydrogenase